MIMIDSPGVSLANVAKAAQVNAISTPNFQFQACLKILNFQIWV